MFKANLAGIFVLAASVMGAAQNAGLYLNFKVDADGNGHISQTVEMCDNCDSSLQIGDGSVSSELNAMLRRLWNPAGSATLTFDSDIDFQEIDGNGLCVVNHEPIVFVANGGKIDGRKKTLKNICYRQALDYSQNLGRMSGPVGVFDSLKAVEAFDLRIENVVVDISAPSENLSGNAANWFHGVGALTGRAIDSKISGIELKNVRLSSLVAGGVVGNAQNTSFSKIIGEDKLILTNNVWMDKSHAAIKGTTKMGAYAACLGGVVGYGMNVSASDVDLSLELSSSQGDFVSLGGVAGQMFMNNSESDLPLTYENVNIRKSLVKGGSAMGGLLGTLLAIENGKGLNVNINNASFDGEITNSVSDSVFVGGFIARTQLLTDELSIVKGSSNLSLNDERNTKAIYYNAGGFIGGMGSYLRSESNTSFVSIQDSKVTGSLTITDKSAKRSSSTGYVAVGGAAGVVYMSATERAFVNNKVDVSIAADLNLTSTDSLEVGGFFGYAGMREGAQAGFQVRSSEYAGSIRIDGTEGRNFVGGAVGDFRKGENGNYISFDQVTISAKNSATLISINGKESETAALNSYSYVGGVCGVCRTPSLNKGAVHGNIEVLGNLENADSLFVGGFFGVVTTGSPEHEFHIQNAYHIGDIELNLPEKTDHPIYVGYMAGKLSLNNTSASHTLMSNYHYGADTWDAFGSFISGNMKFWLASARSCDVIVGSLCWDVKYNIRNGAKTDVDDNDNGTYVKAYMKDELSSLLNTPYRMGLVDDKVWTYDAAGAENGGYPYWIGQPIADNPVDFSSSSVKPNSSASEELSSSGVEPTSSSGTGLKPTSSSGVNSSSSVKDPESSSAVPESSSSEQQDLSSSSENILESSSSEEDEVSSSSESIVVDAPSVNQEPLVWRAGSWRIVSPKGLKSRKMSRRDAMYQWNENILIGEFWQYQAYRLDENDGAENGIWYQGAEDVIFHAKKPVADAQVVWNVDSIYSGWNLVANPYGFSIDLSSCDDMQNVRFWRWISDEGDYDNSEYVLGPYEGAWIKTDSRQTIKCSVKPVSGLFKKALAKTENSDGWALRAILSDDFGKKDSRNVMGMASREELDDEPPAGMGGYVRLAIVDNDRLLSKSLKQDADELAWNVRLSASNTRDGYLKLEGIDQVNALGKKVFVTVDGRTTEMRDGTSLKVALKSSAKEAVVTVTSKDLSVMATAGNIRGLNGLSSANGLNVRFELDENMAGLATQVDLVSVSGKVAASEKLSSVAGINNVNLKVQKHGLYVLRVRVGGLTATRHIAVR